MSRRRRLLLLALPILVAAPASAHQTAVSRVEAVVRAEQGEVDLLFAIPSRDLADRLRLDARGDGALDPDELAAGERAVRTYLEGTVLVRSEKRRCAPSGTGVLRLAEVPTHVLWIETFACPGPIRRLHLEARTLFETGPYRHFARIQVGDAIETTVFDPQRPGWDLTVGHPAAAAALADTMVRYLWQGVLHILGGIDHVLFVICLLLVARSLRRLLGVVTAFTAAHTITLILSALNVVTLSPQIVEPAIAASIAFVAFGNIVTTLPRRGLSVAGVGGAVLETWTLEEEGAGAREAAWRYLVPFLFGLVHGFGFSYVLRDEVGLPTGALLPALVSFNVGVELGQLAVVLTLWPLLRLAMRRPGYRLFLWAASLAAGTTALWWLGSRLSLY